MKLKFLIPKALQNHKISGAVVIDARDAVLLDEEVIELEGEAGAKVVLLLAPEEEGSTSSYAAFEFDGQRWGQVELPIFAFEEIVLKEQVLEERRAPRKLYPDLSRVFGF
ncbi:hypothetical protein GTO10_06945 [Candidatus Saccharibacteria bacterium]|nr:hypothetical protein [Candidatus Saccharibacteria bacterium]